VRALFTHRTPVDPRSLPRFSMMNSDGGRNVATPPESNQCVRIEGAVLMPADTALDDLQRKLRSGRLRDRDQMRREGEERSRCRR
jgi:hypothetical protein